TSTMRLPPVTVKSMSNLTFDWTGVTNNFLGNPVSSTGGLTLVSLLLFVHPLAEVEKKLNEDTLALQDVEVIPPPSWPAPGMTTGGKNTAPLHEVTATRSADQPATTDHD